MIPIPLLCWLVLCWWSALPDKVTAQEPQVTYTKFSSSQEPLHFFANSTSALYVDGIVNNTIFVTNDEGRTWSGVDIPNDIRYGEVTMHPYDNQYAFIETNDGTFHKTSNQGMTWETSNLPGLRSYVRERFVFHPGLPGYILIARSECDALGPHCHQVYYLTRDGFASEPTLLLQNAQSCFFAHSLEGIPDDVHQDLVLCLVQERSDDWPYTSRLVASNDFFHTDERVIDLGSKRDSYYINGLSFVGKFAIVDMFLLNQEGRGRLTIVSTDLNHWERIHLPNREGHYSTFSLSENKLGIIDGPRWRIGTLYVSDSNGNYFVEALENVRSPAWFDWRVYDKVAGVEHVAIANVNSNYSEWDSSSDEFRSRISFDNGSKWRRVMPSFEDASNPAVPCDPRDEETCSLHFHPPGSTEGRLPRSWKEDMRTTSPAAGVIIRAGSIGPSLLPYEDCDTFISTDGGLSWNFITSGPHRAEYANHGNTIVLVKDTDDTDGVHYSTDSGKTWTALSLEHRIYPQQLSASSAEASDTFFLIGRVAHENEPLAPHEVLVFSLDFSELSRQECNDDDFEKWYARDDESSECILGHREWYLRRRIGRDCSIGRKFQQYETKGIEGDCPCTEADYECGFNHARKGNVCVTEVPESIPAGACHSNQGSYWGPSGYRLKAGNTCDKLRGVVMDEPVQKECAMPQLPEGEVAHIAFQFPKEVVQFEYLGESETILIRLRDGSVWQSRNEGYTWVQLFPEERFLALTTHKYSPHRAYLLTHSNTYFYTTDSGRGWNQQTAPAPSNTFGAPILSFGSSIEYLLWVGDVGCNATQSITNCHSEAYYSTDHGRNWRLFESYVHHCEWARDTVSARDASQITCVAYGRKEGNQRHLSSVSNPLQFVTAGIFSKEKHVEFQNIVGFLRSPDYDLVVRYRENSRSLAMLASRDGSTFSEAVFPAGFHPDDRVLEILDTTPRSVFMFLIMSESPNPPWGAILKSDAAGATHVVSLDYTNKNGHGRIDFTRHPLLQGIALANVVVDPDDSAITGRKEIVTKISRNDGGSWRSLTPPDKDSIGREYACEPTTESACALHLYAFSERPNVQSAITVPSRPDLLISVGNVGEVLAPYGQSNTFLSRDAGLHWSEIRKGTHVWAFGDGGSLLVMASDSAATNRVIYSTDEGLTWHEYVLKGMDKIRVRSIITSPENSSRRFVLLGYRPPSIDSFVAVQLDFSFLTKRRCALNEENPEESDFEHFSPVGEDESCLFGQRALYQRRIRTSNCYIGDVTVLNRHVIENCPCSRADFECEFNHARDSTGVCVLEPGASSLPNNTSCAPGEDRWYERTAYRRIGYSTCEGGLTLDRGPEHECITKSSWSLWNHGWLFWMTVLYLSVALGVLTAYAVFRFCGFARGKIRLAEDDETELSSGSRVAKVFVVPLFIGNFAARSIGRVARTLPTGFWRKKSGEREEDEHLLGD